MPIIHAYLYESAGKIKKVAEILKKHLTNELQGCILAPSNGKGVVSDEGCYQPPACGALSVCLHNLIRGEINMTNVPEYFGSMVFNDQKMKARLPHATYKALKKTIQNGEPLDISVATAVANAMKDWAVEMGCTHYTHWFQPMTGVTA